MQQLTSRLGWLIAGVLALLVVAALTGVIGAGPLDPTNSPNPTMKTLQEVEPRTPIQSLPGSAAALHVISAPGSYYLTGNLVGQPGKDAIRLTSGNVTIDLNGFTLDGASTGTTGISLSVSLNDVVVRNGSIRNWLSHGISAAGLSQRWLVEDVQVLDVGGTGIVLGSSATVRNVLVSGNDAEGISTTQRALVENAQAIGNSSNGISVAEDSVVRNSVARQNGLDGIRATEDATIIDNLSFNNGTGIHITWSGGRIEHNEVSDNDYGILVDSTFNVIIRNIASLNALGNYQIVANNTVGPIVNSGNIATSSNPHANYTP